MRYTLYKVVKGQTNILGYWKDDKKIYIDNIKIVECKNQAILKIKKQFLFDNGELAVFYKDNTQGYIEDKQGKINILSKRIEHTRKTSYNNVKFIKELIKKYGGCTVFKKRGYILIEIWTN